MAYYRAALPSKAAAAADAWPSAANLLATSWLGLASAVRQGRRLPDTFAEQTQNPCPSDFLRGATSQTQPPPSLSNNAWTSTISSRCRDGLHLGTSMRRLSRMQPQAPAPFALRPFTRTGLGTAFLARGLSSMRRHGSNSCIVGAHYRGFGTSNGISRNQLAAMEESANRNPGNANAQNSFYQLLLRANMPGILVERHQSGRFATNAATEETYQKALAALNSGTNSTASTPASPLVGRGQWPGHELSYGATLPASNSHVVNAMGVKGEPIHVVVQESTSSYLFRWIKFFATYVVILYITFVLTTVAIEALSSFRRPPGVKSADSEVKAESQTTRFSDVHGCDEAKEELQEVVEFLRNPSKFTDLGAKLPKGVLLVGPPGTGKTLLARAVAGEAGVPFFYMSGSEFDEIYVGVGAKRVRELFNAAKAKSPAIVFIDELDAIGAKRNPRDQAHSKQTLNQLLTELDGFDQETKIVIMGATNLPNLLDKALTRPGRFDRHINVELPDFRGRLAILKHHAKKVKLAGDIDLKSVAARCPGRSGAELENMLNIAALRASRARASIVSMKDLDWAFDRILMGSERKSMVVTGKEKEMTAYHEAGHAIVQLFENDNPNRLYKVTILPKGPTLGHTAQVPQVDRHSTSAAEYMSTIRVLLGGKMAEEMRYGDDKVTSGVYSDLQRATDLSFMMITQFGMSNALGPVEYGRRYGNLSSETRAMIEAEVQKTLKKSYEDVRRLLTERRKELDLLAQALVQYETLDKAEVELVIRGEKLPGRTAVPKGPLVLPIPAEAPQPPGLGGVPQPQPPATPAPPAPAASSDAGSS